MGADNAAPPSTPGTSADVAGLPGGYRLLEYEIERQLGGGGFGITYLARDINLDLPVAVKEYFPSDSVARGPNHLVQVRGDTQEVRDQYQWGLERFLDEARALASFRHPNIVRVLRYFRENGTAYIVMEYESGDPLKRWVPHHAPLSQRALLSVIYPLLDGLESVHKTGFLHRDIKPDNIYVRADGTPVLLDFGSARKVAGHRDMTNIVSPGFAPFEQYHSQGNQGPWTDIYSLGAVMYWMVTGKKPVESAARVKTDTLLPATSLAEASVFGQHLLEAIDWAMSPDEAKRPQTVAALRAAIHGSERVDTQMLDVDLAPGAGLGPSGYAPPAAATSGPRSSSQTSQTSLQRKNLLCTIMFLDLVGYSIRSVDDQVAIKKLFNELIGKALMGVEEGNRIAIDTGDGAAICFLGDPEEALHSAMLLRDLLTQRYGNHLSVRIGLHMGPVRVISDINERVNVIGDGINVAQRIMDFAQGNQVLVSRAYYDVISRITDDTAGMFQYLGQFGDKHSRLHEVYSVSSGSMGTTRREGPATGYTQTRPSNAGAPLNPAQVAEVEAELVRHIGPLAKVLVRKALPLAGSIGHLRESLGPSIQDSKAREAFVHGGHGHNTAGGHSRPSGSPTARPSPLTQPLGPTTPSGPRGGQTMRAAPLSQPAGKSVPGPFDASHGPASRSMPLGPSSRSMPLSQPSRPMPLSQPHGPQDGAHSSRSAWPAQIPAEELTVIEKTLSKFIGPMAKMIVRKEAGRAASYRDFVVAVAENIDQPVQREAFITELKRVLPRH